MCLKHGIYFMFTDIALMVFLSCINEMMYIYLNRHLNQRDIGVTNWITRCSKIMAFLARTNVVGGKWNLIKSLLQPRDRRKPDYPTHCGIYPKNNYRKCLSWLLYKFELILNWKIDIYIQFTRILDAQNGYKIDSYIFGDDKLSAKSDICCVWLIYFMYCNVLLYVVYSIIGTNNIYPYELDYRFHV